MNKIKQFLSDSKKRVKEVIKDIFYPYKETAEGVRDVWFRIFQKKEIQTKMPPMNTIPTVFVKEKPDGLIEATNEKFKGYPLTSADLTKIRYGLTEIKKSSPSFIDVILANERYSIIFDRYPRIGRDGEMKDRYEVIIACDGKTVYTCQIDSNENDPTETFYVNLMQKSTQWTQMKGKG